MNITMQSRLKAFKAGNQVGGNQPDESFCEIASCWFQQLRPSGSRLMKNCHAHRQVHRHTRSSTPQMVGCIVKDRLSCPGTASVSKHSWSSASERRRGSQLLLRITRKWRYRRGWPWSHSWEEKGVEEPEQQEKPNHGNVSLPLQTHRDLKVLLMEQQQSDGSKNFSSQGKT